MPENKQKQNLQFYNCFICSSNLKNNLTNLLSSPLVLNFLIIILFFDYAEHEKQCKAKKCKYQFKLHQFLPPEQIITAVKMTTAIYYSHNACFFQAQLEISRQIICFRQKTDALAVRAVLIMQPYVSICGVFAYWVE